jgi:hypothetical protein
VDALFLQNLMSRVQLRPPFLDTNSFLTQDLDDFLLNEFAALSAAAGASDDDDDEEDEDGEFSGGEARRRRMLAREEAKLEKEIVRMVLAGKAEEKLKPNSGQSVAIGDHHLCVGFHNEAGGSTACGSGTATSCSSTTRMDTQPSISTATTLSHSRRPRPDLRRRRRT